MFTLITADVFLPVSSFRKQKSILCSINLAVYTEACHIEAEEKEKRLDFRLSKDFFNTESNMNY